MGTVGFAGRASGVAVRPRGRVPERTVLLVASFGAFLAFLDATIVNVAFPSLQAAFPSASIPELSWVLNAYNIVFAALLIISGRLADLIGRRRAFLLGVLVFTAASLWCALSGGVPMLVAARLVQAAGAALLVPASLALVVEAFPAAKRAHAITLWGASAALASGLGPPIGGALVQSGGWRWAFLVNLPFGIAALVLGRVFLVESRAPGRRRLPDLKGAALSAFALASLTLGIVKGNQWGWTSAGVIGSFALAVVLFAFFVQSSRHSRSPLLDPALLRIRGFAVGNAASVVAGGGFYAYLLTNILWLQYVWHYDVLRAGLALVPGALVAAVVAALLGPVASERGYRRVVVPGALVWALAYVWYATRVGVTPDFLGQWLPGQVLSGIGVGATLPILGSAALAAVPGGRFATASAVNSSARQLGAVLGISLLVVILGGSASSVTVSTLRHGWVFSALCFTLVALVVALALGRVRAAAPEEEDAGGLGEPVVGLPNPVPTARLNPAAALAADPLLSRLPAETQQHLLDDAEHVGVAGGEWLFRAGDRAAELYVVESGRLEVVIDDAVVRELHRGDLIGELALLTGEPRSASIRAARDSRLLRIGQAQFESALEGHPTLLRELAASLATRVRETPNASFAPPPRSDIVAVLALDSSTAADDVAAALAGQLRRRVRVAVPGRVDLDGLVRAEQENERVLLAADSSDPDWWRWCARQADRVVLAAAADSPVPDPAALGLEGPAPDLVLVGGHPGSERVNAWLDALRPWQLCLTEAPALPTALESLASRISGTSLGLVLGGGGARAFAHIGVIDELLSAGLTLDRIAGTSQGAIVAALFATGADAKAVQEMCYQEFVRRRPFSDYTLPTAAMTKGRRAEAALRRHVGDHYIEALPRQFRCSSTDLQTRTRHAHRNGPAVEAAMASAALPVLFPPRRLDGALLVDGGVLDNLPVRLLTERDEGPVVAVNIGLGGDERPRPTSTGQPRPLRMPSLGETLLRTMFIGSGGAVNAAREAGVVVVTPASSGVGLLEFHQLDRMVESGRAAGRALLEQAAPFLGL